MTRPPINLKKFFIVKGGSLDRAQLQVGFVRNLKGQNGIATLNLFTAVIYSL